MNRVLSLLLLFISCTSLFAQPGGNERDAFLGRSNAAAKAYRARKALEYGDFLRRGWTAAAESAPVEDPFRQGETAAPPDGPFIPTGSPAREDILSGGGLALPFYGRTYKVRCDRLPDLALPSVSESDVAAAWDRLSAGTASLLEDCQSIRLREELCDWAYLQLVDSLSGALCPHSGNEYELLFGFLLGRSGYNIRFGRSDDRLTCLYGTEQIIYERPYFLKDGITYYRHRPGDGPLSISEPVPEGARPLDLRLPGAPKTGPGPVPERHVRVGDIGFDFRIPQGLLDFYGRYPHTEMFVKADAPVSASVRECVYPALRTAVSGKGEVEATGVLLHFVQGLMAYQRDDERWGFEKWNFPEESLWYQCGDCDDHAILFARLVRDLLDLDVLLVECRVNGSPHASTAVRFTEPLDGDSILYEGQIYYCCEPSSNAARVGDRCWENYTVTRLDKVK